MTPLRRAAGLALEMPGVESEGAGEAIQAKSKKGWRTYQPSVLKRKRTHGFRRLAARPERKHSVLPDRCALARAPRAGRRMSTKAGRRVLQRRRDKGRWKVAVT